MVVPVIDARDIAVRLAVRCPYVQLLQALNMWSDSKCLCARHTVHS
jgi:hypothetical protein